MQKNVVSYKDGSEPLSNQSTQRTLTHRLTQQRKRTIIPAVFLLSLVAGIFTLLPQHTTTHAKAVSVPDQTRVGVHNAYEKATFPYLIDALESGTALVEIDVWQNFLFSDAYNVSHSPIGNDNNCEKATSYKDLRHQERDQDFASCLQDIRLWQGQHPHHPLLFLKLELKNGFDTEDGFGPAQLDAMLAKYLGANTIFRPAELKGTYKDLDSAARAGAWPSADQLTGKIMVLLQPGAFELKVKDLHSDQEYATYLSQLRSKNQFDQAMSFPIWQGIAAKDPRASDRQPWSIVFDGDATSALNIDTSLYRINHYLVIMTDAQRVPPAIDDHNPAVQDAIKRVNLLAAHEASIASSDWPNPQIEQYTTTRA